MGTFIYVGLAPEHLPIFNTIIAHIIGQILVPSILFKLMIKKIRSSDTALKTDFRLVILEVLCLVE